MFRIALVVGLLGMSGCSTTAPFALPVPVPTAVDAIAPAPSTSLTLPISPVPPTEDKPLAINLPTALQLANVRAADIAAAVERIRIAAAMLERADVLWLPTITIGGDYARHDGNNQDANGNVINNSHGSLMFGLGTGIGSAAILNVNDAIFAPLVARQQLKGREADRRTVSNDTLVAVTDAYFNVQQARGELGGALDAIRRNEELVRRTRKLAIGLVPELEVLRAEAELVRRQQAGLLARERWKVAGAELLRILRLDSTAQVAPVEPPQLHVDLINLRQPVDDLIPLGLLHRPELASQQAQVQTTLALLKQEKLRPLIPSVLLRGYSTPVTGTLGAGIFAGGANGTIGNAGLRSDFDLQVLWQLDNLGFGNVARVHQRQAENRLAAVELFRLQDRIAAEIAQAYAQAQLAAERVELAEKGIRFAVDSADKNLIAVGQTKIVGNQNTLLVRPQEAVAAIQALSQAYVDYYGAVGDANRAQFRLYRALGQPAECVIRVDSVPKAISSVAPSVGPSATVATDLGYGEAVPAPAKPTDSGISRWVEMTAPKAKSEICPAKARLVPERPRTWLPDDAANKIP